MWPVVSSLTFLLIVAGLWLFKGGQDPISVGTVAVCSFTLGMTVAEWLTGRSWHS